MAGTKLVPEKITSPFQLMAAWFSMLILLVSVLLTAAVNITRPDWAAGYLVIFSSIVVVAVLGCVTLMLTVFRPHLQEGKEYAQWLRDTNTYSPGLIVKERTTVKRARRTSALASSMEIDRNFNVLVNAACPGSADVLAVLHRARFSAEEYRSPGAVDRHRAAVSESAAIWIGSRVQGAAAVEAIKFAMTAWPHLKYMHLSSDDLDPPDEIHDQIFFGGATSTAKRFGLRAWSAEEVRDLPSNITDADLHKAVRGKYS